MTMPAHMKESLSRHPRIRNELRYMHSDQLAGAQILLDAIVAVMYEGSMEPHGQRWVDLRDDLSTISCAISKMIMREWEWKQEEEGNN